MIPTQAKAKTLADKWGVATAFRSVDEAAGVEDAIFDLATPPDAHADDAEAHSRRARRLIQKPMGSYLGEATEILEDLPRRKSSRRRSISSCASRR